MLLYSSKLRGTPIISFQTNAPVGQVADIVIDPDNLHIIALRASGPLINRSANILSISSIRGYSSYGIVIDGVDEFVADDDIIHVSEILALNFDLIGLKVESKQGHNIGRVIDYTVDTESYIVQQIIVKRPLIKSLSDPVLTIHRKEIVEITDYKIIVKDEAKTIKARSEKEDFVPNFVNPFRKSEPNLAPADSQTPADKDTA